MIAQAFSVAKPYPLKESTSTCINIPQCAVLTASVLKAMDLRESKEAELQRHNQRAHVSENDYKEIMSRDDLNSMEPPHLSSDEEMHHEVTETYASSDESVLSEDHGIQRPLSYAEITEMMGTDTFGSDFADNLFREEGGRAQDWFSPHNRMPAGHREMVDWIRTTSDKHQFADTTQFRALFYLDKLCALKHVVSKHLRTTAAVCLYLAAKYNEVDANVPRLARFCGRHLDAGMMIESEVAIVNAFGFQLKAVLPIDFVSHWIGNQRVIFADDLVGDNRASASGLRQCAKSLQRFSVFFLNMAASNHAFWAFSSSTLAAAVLCAARRVLRIAPYWNPKLASVVRHEPRDLAECFNALWTEYARRFPRKCKNYTAMQPQTMAEFV